MNINNNYCMKMFVSFCKIFIISRECILESWIIQRGKLLNKILMRMPILIWLLQSLSIILEVVSHIRVLWLEKLYHLKKESLLRLSNCHCKMLLNRLARMAIPFHKRRNKNVYIFLMSLRMKTCITLDSQNWALMLLFL